MKCAEHPEREAIGEVVLETGSRFAISPEVVAVCVECADEQGMLEELTDGEMVSPRRIP